MYRIRKVFLALSVIVVLISLLPPPVLAQNMLQNAMRGFEKDADKARLEHLVYWTGLFEEYKNKAGYYPLQNGLNSDKPGLVRIATKEQQAYFDKSSKQYKADIDNNADGRFQEFPMKLLVEELEHKLDRTVDEKYDIQKAPYKGPNYYNYFVTKDGYLMWVVCNSCGVTKISTLLMDGSTATVNIVSESMIGKVIKALPRDQMIAHPIFKEWMALPYDKEGFVREREKEKLHDSKTYQ